MKVLIFLGTVMVMTSIDSFAHAECYGLYVAGGWKTECGKIPDPPSRFAVPTVDNALNKNDKLYLCSMAQVSEIQCADVEFSSGAGGISGASGLVQFGLDIRMKLHNKQCAGVVWKTYLADNTWVLSSPTSIFGFPYECEFSDAR